MRQVRSSSRGAYREVAPPRARTRAADPPATMSRANARPPARPPLPPLPSSLELDGSAGASGFVSTTRRPPASARREAGSASATAWALSCQRSTALRLARSARCATSGEADAPFAARSLCAARRDHCGHVACSPTPTPSPSTAMESAASRRVVRCASTPTRARFTRPGRRRGAASGATGVIARDTDVRTHLANHSPAARAASALAGAKLSVERAMLVAKAAERWRQFPEGTAWVVFWCWPLALARRIFAPFQHLPRTSKRLERRG